MIINTPQTCIENKTTTDGGQCCIILNERFYNNDALILPSSAYP